MAALELVAAVTKPHCAAEIQKISRAVTWLQIRSDLIGDIPAAWLRAHFPGKLLYTLRTFQAGGKFDRSVEERRSRLIAAAREYDLIELEFDSDMRDDFLSAIPAGKRMIVWHGAACDTTKLQFYFQQMIAASASYYCLISSASRSSDGLQPILFLKDLRRRDVVAFCDGPAGLWSRLLSPQFGSPLLFGQLDTSLRQSGEPHIEQLITDYGFPAIHPVQEIYGMVGNRIFQSPSPRLHNGAFRLLKHPGLFLPFHVEDFADFWQGMVESRRFEQLGTPIQGLVIVSPHKNAAAAVADENDLMVRKAEASNVFVHRERRWYAETTDPESISAIRHACPLNAAVIGCGGAGRAVAAALQQTGSKVTLVNRGLRRGEYAGNLLGLPFIPLPEFRAHGFDLIVNATPVGKENDEFPFVIDTLANGTLVVDLAYGARPTPLVSAVLARGGKAVDGYDVLLTQVRKQFQIMTGLEMPAVISRETVLPTSATSFVSPETVLATGGATEACEYSF